MNDQELRKLIEKILNEIASMEKPSKRGLSNKHYSMQGNEIENLIGSIPFILLDKNVFAKNMDVVEFAEKIGIHIAYGEKKKLSEIVGRIIEAIAEFPPSKISQLNIAISKLKTTSKSKKKDKASFFKEWDNVIKNIEL